jgi:hypothetical protein
MIASPKDTDPILERVRATRGRGNGRQGRELARNWHGDSIRNVRRPTVGFHMGNIGYKQVKGMIDELKVYKRTLSGDEVAAQCARSVGGRR